MSSGFEHWIVEYERKDNRSGVERKAAGMVQPGSSPFVGSIDKEEIVLSGPWVTDASCSVR